jgi:hypothetical protein
VKSIKTRIAAGATILGLGGLTGLALSAGHQRASQPVAAKPLVRTQVIRRTIHVVKHAKPKPPAGGAPLPGAAGAAYGAGSASAGVATGSSSAGSASPSSAPVTTSSSGAAGSTGSGSAPIVTRTSGAGGGGGSPVVTHTSGGEHEHESREHGD